MVFGFRYARWAYLLCVRCVTTSDFQAFHSAISEKPNEMLITSLNSYKLCMFRSGALISSSIRRRAVAVLSVLKCARKDIDADKSANVKWIVDCRSNCNCVCKKNAYATHGETEARRIDDFSHPLSLYKHSWKMLKTAIELNCLENEIVASATCISKTVCQY